MNWIRFHLASVMALVLFVAVSLAALRSASPAWASMLFTLATALPLAAILKAVSCRGVERLPWIGFAIFGLGYLSVTFHSWLNQGTGLRFPLTLPAVALENFAPYTNPAVADSIAMITPPVAGGGRAAARRLEQQRSAYLSCCGSLSTLFFALLGAILGRALATSSRQHLSRSENTIQENPGRIRQNF